VPVVPSERRGGPVDSTPEQVLENMPRVDDLSMSRGAT
jgi:hypothetical protein